MIDVVEVVLKDQGVDGKYIYSECFVNVVEVVVMVVVKGILGGVGIVKVQLCGE